MLLLVSWLWPEPGEALMTAEPRDAIDADTRAPAAAWIAPIDVSNLAVARSAPASTQQDSGSALPDDAAAATSAARDWQEVTVQSGDSLARIFQRAGIAAADLHRLVNSASEAQRLTRIHPGEKLAYRLDQAGSLQAVRYHQDRLRTLQFTREDSGRFAASQIEREAEIRTRLVEGEIESSLFLAGARHGLNDNLIMSLAQIFQWDIDFVHDIRRGDRFAVLFEERWLDDELIGTGAILAARFNNRGREHEAVRYQDSEGEVAYFAPDGRSMRRAFLRAPVEFSRISSNFNMRRMHPIHNRVVPHRGIDYAAPTGTPVMAAGDGVVTTAASHHANGNYIILRHGEQYETKYLHLHRFGRGIRNGTRVRQGQVIGYVGATGWATGPHLHYEFLVNGVHQNPRTVRLPQAEPVAATERDRFERLTSPVLAELHARLDAAPARIVASRNSGESG